MALVLLDKAIGNDGDIIKHMVQTELENHLSVFSNIEVLDHSIISREISHLVRSLEVRFIYISKR